MANHAHAPTSVEAADEDALAFIHDSHPRVVGVSILAG